MVTFRVELASAPNRDGQYPVRLRITAQRQHKRISLGFAVSKKDFNPKAVLDKANWIRSNNSSYLVYNQRIAGQISIFLKVINQLIESNPNPTVLQVLRAYNDYFQDGSFLEFFQGCLQEIKSVIDISTFEGYTSRYHLFTQFLIDKQYLKAGKPYLAFNQIDEKFCNELEAYISIGRATTTTNTYMIFYRGFITKAFKKGKLKSNPLEEYSQIKNNAEPIKLNETQIQQIIDLKLNAGYKDRMSQSRDIFLFMYYTYGCRIGDALFMKVGDVYHIDNQYRFIYTTQKTEKQLNVKLPPQAIEIYLKYAEGKKKSDYLFPFVNPDKDYRDKETFYKEKKSKTAIVDTYLKKICSHIDGIKISNHTARHSFADLSRRKNKNLYAISKSLGHSKLSTTEIYLKRFDQDSIDDMSDSYNE